MGVMHQYITTAGTTVILCLNFSVAQNSVFSKNEVGYTGIHQRRANGGKYIIINYNKSSAICDWQ